MGTIKMRAVFDYLSTQGFNEKDVREHCLPDWWEDEIATTPAGYGEGLRYIARNLRLDLKTLREIA